MFEFIKQGLLGLILWLNSLIKDFGITIITFTLILKIVLLPLEFLAFLEEEKMKRIGPKIKEALKKYKNDILKQAEVLNEIYQKEKYNPFFTFIIQFLPLPIFISIFFVLKEILVKYPSSLFFLSINLSERNLFLILATIIFQFLTNLTLPKNQQKVGFFFLGLIALILFQFPALFTLYWLTNLVITFLERNFFKFYYAKFVIKSVQENE